MLTCPKCNFDNELGRIFCHQCGTKLDLDSIKPPSRGGKPLKRKGSGPGRTVSIVIRLVIVAALVVVIAMMFQMPQVENIATTTKDLNSFYTKRTRLESATFQRKEMTVTMTEPEVNAFVDNIQFEDAEGRGIKLVPTNIQIELEDGRAVAYVLGKIQLGDKWEKGLGISYTGVPATEDGKFVFRPVTARIGKLPIAKFILENTGFVESYFKQVFGKLDTEIDLLNKLASIEVDDQALVLTYKPTAAAPAP